MGAVSVALKAMLDDYPDGGTQTVADEWETRLLRFLNPCQHYGSLDSASEPSEDMVGGDEYYNSDLNRLMFYDASRSKWLSQEVAVFSFGSTAAIVAGALYEGTGRTPFNVADAGMIMPLNATVVGVGMTCLTGDSEVKIRDNTSVLVTLAHNTAASTDAANADVASGQIVIAINSSGGETVTDAIGWFSVRWRK